MRKVYRNQYKRHDIFSCNHSSHHRFGGTVSTYYILEEKQCYPDGCINFVWRCQLLNKGHSCPKKFSHVGRKCFSCKHFYENKYQQTPRLKVSDEEYHNFLNELEDFNYWIDENQQRQVEIDAEIIGVKPNLKAFGSIDRPYYRMYGWILVFDQVYIGYDLFEDIAFAKISEKAQDRLLFRAGDILEASAKFNFMRGRLVFSHVHNIDLKTRGDEPLPDGEDILVAAQTATSFPVQPEKCMHCDQGVLAEARDNDSDRSGPSRTLVCLRGERNPLECIYHLKPQLRSR